ncbi:unnamed protein product [Closterium sp. NIES-64]|nr:unnamed protein product [Closterium sp. NIES-64]
MEVRTVDLAAIAAHGSFSIAISGGSVVKCLGQLAHPDIAARCDWSRWHVFWVDERAVPLTHPDSNYLLAHTHWLSKVPIPSAHIHTLDDSLPVEAAAEAYEREMARCVEAGVLPMHPVLLSAAVVAVVAMGEGKRELLGRLFEAGGTGWVLTRFLIRVVTLAPPVVITLSLPVVAVVAMGGGEEGAAGEAV